MERSASSQLKVNEVTHSNVERLGDTDENIDADVGRSCLDFPEVGAARARHERKLSLRYAAPGALSAYSGTNGPLLLRVVHAGKDRSGTIVTYSL